MKQNTPLQRIPVGHDLVAQVRHWLRTPANAYLGSGYGNDLKAVIATPFGDGKADAQVDKLQQDVQGLQALPAGSVNLYTWDVPPDRVMIGVEIAGQMVEAGLDAD